MTMFTSPLLSARATTLSILALVHLSFLVPHMTHYAIHTSTSPQTHIYLSLI